MKDYAVMSDNEIAEKVGKAIGLHSIAGDLYIKNGVWTRFDPCNNPADAWPIIISSMISIRPVGNDGQLWEAAGMDGMKADYDKNPLRASMVVFLMMKESKND